MNTTTAGRPSSGEVLYGLIGAAVRLVFGAALASLGVAQLVPMVLMAFGPQHGSWLHASWFDWSMPVALVASGALLVTRKGVLLAWTLLIPVSMHLVLHLVLFGR